MTRRPADRVIGSIDPWWQIVIERRRRERLRAEMARRQRTRERWERVRRLFSLRAVREEEK